VRRAGQWWSDDRRVTRPGPAVIRRSSGGEALASGGSVSVAREVLASGGSEVAGLGDPAYSGPESSRGEGWQSARAGQWWSGDCRAGGRPVAVWLNQTSGDDQCRPAQVERRTATCSRGHGGRHLVECWLAVVGGLLAAMIIRRLASVCGAMQPWRLVGWSAMWPAPVAGGCRGCGWLLLWPPLARLAAVVGLQRRGGWPALQCVWPATGLASSAGHVPCGGELPLGAAIGLTGCVAWREWAS
jgi:hypothetical protein